MNKYEAFKVIRESNLALERRSKAIEGPIKAVMSWRWDLGGHSKEFNLKTIQSSIPETFKLGATEIYNYSGSDGEEQIGNYWWLCLRPRVSLEELKFGAGAILSLDPKKVDEFKAEFAKKHQNDGKHPSLEEIIELGTDLTNWRCSTNASDISEVNDPRNRILMKKILELAGGDYKQLSLTRKNIRILNSVIKPQKLETLTDEELKKIIELAKTKFTDKTDNFLPMKHALELLGFRDINGIAVDEHWLGPIIAKYKGNPVYIDTASALNHVTLVPEDSRCITQDKYDELSKRPEYVFR